MSATSPAVSPIPPGMHTITPHLAVHSGVDAILFYVKAFDAVELARLHAPDGRLLHAMLRIGDSPLMLVDEDPTCGIPGPGILKGTPVTLHLYVADIDASFTQAVKAGCRVAMPPADMFWGDRYGVLIDPFGHRWSLATHIRDVDQQEIEAAAAKLCATA